MEELLFGRRYRAIEKIGSGGMADVYKANDEVLGRTVAVKVLHPRYATEPNFVARFRQEAQAAANLSHPNIVNIYDWGREAETYYIVMEYVNGTDLKSLVAQRGPLDPLKVAEYGQQVCAALSVAHGYDVIHRDIKPHNIVLTPDGTVKVMDFGIARAGNTTMTQTGSVLGTAQYISPEQAQGKALGAASDLYSLGVTLYELAAGQLPFDRETPVATALAQVNEEPTAPRRIRPEIPSALEQVILRAMQKNPQDRYASAAEMREDLQRVAKGQPVAAASYGAVAGALGRSAAADETSVMPAVTPAMVAQGDRPQIRPVPERRTSPWVWVGVAALVIALAVGIALALGAFGGGKVVVPTLTGLTEQEATTELAKSGLELGQVKTEASEDVKLGLIISQDPEAGDKVEKGASVNVVVSGGLETVEIPDVKNMAEADAIKALRALGLEYDKSNREANTEVEKDKVIGTDPEIGTEVPKGTRVVLIVSLGVETVKVPDVIGKPLASAKAELETLLLVVSTAEAYSDTVPKGNVISQRPDPNVLVEAGSTITLTVSKGVEVIIVPDVIEMPEAEAKSVLTAAGLVPKVVYEDGPEDGIVINQNPIPNASAKRGDVVVLTVTKNAAP